MILIIIWPIGCILGYFLGKFVYRKIGGIKLNEGI